MIFKSKFEFGDIVYTIEKRYEYETCTLCEGEGKVEAVLDENLYKFRCPKCNGSKKNPSPTPIWKVKETEHCGFSSLSPKVEAKYTIKEIIISENETILVVYIVDEDNLLSPFDTRRLKRKVKETMAFHSKEEAQEYCDKLNQQEIEDGIMPIQN